MSLIRDVDRAWRDAKRRARERSEEKRFADERHLAWVREWNKRIVTICTMGENRP